MQQQQDKSAVTKEVKTVVIKPKPKDRKPDEGEGEFENVADKREGQKGSNYRGDRRAPGDHAAGGRRGRGGRRDRGEDGDDGGEGRGAGRGRGNRDRDGNRESRGGDRPRGGRGRGGDGGRQERGGGGRGRGRDGQRLRSPATDAEGLATVDTAEAGGYRQKFQGKAREEWHPMDRVSGTGRGKRDTGGKGGAGKAGWGDEKEVIEGQPGDGEEKKRGNLVGDEEKRGGGRGHRDDRDRRGGKDFKDRRGPREEEKKPQEPEEDEEEVGFTLDDYYASKQQKKDNLPQAKGRQHEKVTDKLLQSHEVDKIRTKPVASKLTGGETHTMGAGENANLLGFGFTNQDDDDFGGGGRGDRRGRGGGRGRDDRGGRGDRGGHRGGRRKGKPVFGEEDFPAL